MSARIDINNSLGGGPFVRVARYIDGVLGNICVFDDKHAEARYSITVPTMQNNSIAYGSRNGNLFLFYKGTASGVRRALLTDVGSASGYPNGAIAYHLVNGYPRPRIAHNSRWYSTVAARTETHSYSANRTDGNPFGLANSELQVRGSSGTNSVTARYLNLDGGRRALFLGLRLRYTTGTISGLNLRYRDGGNQIVQIHGTTNVPRNQDYWIDGSRTRSDGYYLDESSNRNWYLQFSHEGDVNLTLTFYYTVYFNAMGTTPVA